MAKYNSPKVKDIEVLESGRLCVYFSHGLLIIVDPDGSMGFGGMPYLQQVSKVCRIAKTWMRGELYWKKKWVPYYINKA